MTDRPDPQVSADALLCRLLGPSGPELTCEECFAVLDEYAELELAGGGADAAIPGMLAHLHGCAACQEEHDGLLALLRSDTTTGTEGG